MNQHILLLIHRPPKPLNQRLIVRFRSISSLGFLVTFLVVEKKTKRKVTFLVDRHLVITSGTTLHLRNV